MKLNILLIPFLLLGLKSFAQETETLAGTKWEIQEYYAAFEEIPDERVVYYSSNSNTDYTMNLEGLVYDFQADKVEMFYINDNELASSEDVDYSGADQVSINDVLYTIEEINEDYLKLTNVAYYIETTDENLLPVKTVFEFKKHKTDVVSNVQKQLVKFRILPNPVKDRIFFTEKVDNIKIVDFTGRIVGQQVVNGQYADLSFLPAGSYMLIAETFKRTQYSRIVKY